MSEPTRERMREYLDCLEDKASKCNCENPLDPTMIEGECVKAINAIRALIEKAGELESEVIFQINSSFDAIHPGVNIRPKVQAMLREAGVRVKESADE
jgi:phage terminase small subunit